MAGKVNKKKEHVTLVLGFDHIYCDKCGETFLACEPEFYDFFSRFNNKKKIKVSIKVPLYENDVKNKVFPGSIPCSHDWGSFLRNLYYNSDSSAVKLRNASELDYSNVPSKNTISRYTNFDNIKATKTTDLSDEIGKRFLYNVSFDVSPRKEIYKYDFLEIINIKDTMKCPCCNAELNFKNTRDQQVKNDEKWVEKEKESIIDKIGSSLISNSYSSNGEINVAEYLRNLTNIESSIKYYSDMLVLLVQRCLDSRRDDCKVKALSGKTVKDKLDKELNEIESKINNLQVRFEPESEDVLNELEKCGVVIPVKPSKPAKPADFNKTCPEKPDMKTAGLFNRSKINKENERAISIYKEELKAYNQLLEKYNTSVELYERAMDAYITDKEEYDKEFAYYNSEKNRIINELKERNQQVNQSQMEKLIDKKALVMQKLDNFDDEVSQYVANSIAHQTVVFFNNELSEVTEKIKELMQCKADLLSMEIIHPKYLDYVTLVTIYEYFETGRVSELKGPDGAYNLYESELRQNIIIAKMDVIIKQLEQIKQNQFMVFQSLNEINNGIKNMTNKLEDVSVSLKSIESSSKKTVKKLESIEEYAAVTAYYSEKTAQYAKRQNYLTEALGFLVAFK